MEATETIVVVKACIHKSYLQATYKDPDFWELSESYCTIRDGSKIVCYPRENILEISAYDAPKTEENNGGAN